MTVVRKLWWGKYSLPVAFWLFYCVGIFACFVLAATILFLSRTINARPVAFIFGFALISAYGLTTSVGVWRSAAPYWTSPLLMQRIWALAARIIVAAYIAKTLLGWINGGAQGIVQLMTGEIDLY
jgi:hypothetical protein